VPNVNNDTKKCNRRDYKKRSTRSKGSGAGLRILIMETNFNK